MFDHTPSGPATALARLAQGRDPEAWASLLTLCGEVIRRCCARILNGGPGVDDAVQETLLHLRDDAAQFHAPTGEDADRAAWAWIRAVAVHTALQFLRSERRMRQRQEGYGMQVPVSTSHQEPSDAVISREHAALLRTALAELPSPMRTVVVMHHLEGVAFADIGNALHCRETTARSLAHRGLHRLRSQLRRAGCVLAIPAIGAILAGAEAPAEAGATGLATSSALLGQDVRARTTGLPTSLPTSTTGPVRLGLAGAALLIVALATISTLHRASAENPAPSAPTLDRSEAPRVEVAAPADEDTIAYSIVDEDETDPRAPGYQAPDEPMAMPLFARPRPGDSRVSGRISNRDSTVNGRLLRRGGLLHCCAWDNEQQQLFDGAAETVEQRRSLPPEVARLFFDAEDRPDPEILSDNAHYLQEIDARMEARFWKRNGVLHLLVRQGRKARMLVDADVATPAQRAVLPERVASLLGPEVWQELEAGPMADAMIYIGSDAVGDEPPRPFAAQ